MPYVASVILCGPSGQLEICTLFIFILGSLSDHIICSLTAHLKGSIALVAFIYRLPKNFSDAKAISIAAACKAGWQGSPLMKVVRGEVLRLAWESINTVVLKRSRHIHLLARKKGGNYG